jgi:hypothetical protein
VTLSVFGQAGTALQQLLQAAPLQAADVLRISVIRKPINQPMQAITLALAD